MRQCSISGSVAVFLGAVCWSLHALLIPCLSLPSLLIAGTRSLIAGMALAVTIRPKQLNGNRWMLLYVLSYAGLCLSLVHALQTTSAPIAIGMQYTAMIWLFFGQWIRQRHIDINEGLSVLAIALGVLFFMCSASESGTLAGKGIALSEGVFFALMTLSSKKAAGTNPVGLTAIANLTTGVIVLLLMPSMPERLVALSTQEWFILAFLGVFQIGAGYALYNRGMQTISPQRASVIALWEMILGPVWVALFYHQYPSPLVFVGFLLILGGMVMSALHRAPEV